MLVVRNMDGMHFAYFRTLLCSFLLLSGDLTGYIRLLSPHTARIHIHIRTYARTYCLSFWYHDGKYCSSCCSDFIGYDVLVFGVNMASGKSTK